jgi:hypothetical protein
MAKSTKTQRREKPGPKPDTLKLGPDWQAAVKASLTKKKPAKGWPK